MEVFYWPSVKVKLEKMPKDLSQAFRARAKDLGKRSPEGAEKVDDTSYGPERI